MNRTLLVIQGYAAANERIHRHWPYFLKSGVEGILCVGRNDGKTKWPEIPAGVKCQRWQAVSGKDSYVSGDNLPKLLIDCFRLALSFEDFDDICVVENDSIFVRPMPAHSGGFSATQAAGPTPEFHGPGALHCPWRADRETAARLVSYGEAMFRANLLEGGFPDRFISFLCDLFSVEVRPSRAFSVNLIDTPAYLSAARKYIAEEGYFLHGIKTAEQLNAVTKGLVTL